jgi:excisionase family DNA binding protein
MGAPKIGRRQSGDRDLVVIPSATPEPSSLLPFMTVTYVANYLQVAPRTVRRLIKSADIVAHRVRGQLRITDKDLTTYTRTCRET